ncbi:Fanconi anaemia protein FANCD2 [Halteromyces radiatus]|uniref:Fanconi anaemia protein FANCD2 n=1 Tax=Halteromyces radiatus TaxID=101107 RepID=UPI002221075A|nr:Fanconi anaemia protein FANCD2 [Halteromyces radiatus]KAI8093433.1 Fanconi anaemia protein FANCD2 [Halteromyces radiatus]
MTNSFLDIVASSGCEYNHHANSFLFTVEPSVFRRQLTLTLRSDPNYPDNISIFLQDMQEYTNDIQSLRQCLLSAALSDTVPRTNRSSSVDSLTKTLLAIDILQPIIITNLLERLPEFYDELERDQSSSCTARLILHQLRWLDYVVQPQELTNTLIELIQITPNVIQHEIITTLPDMLNDAEHKPIVVFLKEWMQQHPDLAVPILDALSNLTLHSEYLEDVRETVLERLQSAEIDDLAVMVKFLLQTVTPHTIDMTILELRQKLDLRALEKVQLSQQETSQLRSRHKRESPEALILDSMKLGLQFHKFVCDAWVKSIMALETQRAHKVIDILVLFILYSMTSTKKKAEKIFQKKIQSSLITANLIKETILHHADGLSGYWNTILVLAENLLRFSHQQNFLASCSKALYTNAFRVCDAYHRQEIIGALVTHIGSGSTSEMDVALEVLYDLAKTDVTAVAVYNVFIKGILDYLDNLTISQTRTLFDIFSILALKDDHYANDSSLWSDIQIVLRKQLSNPRVKYKVIGIIGSVSAVKILGDLDLCNDAAESSTQSNISTESISRHPLLQQAVNLLEMVIRSCAIYPTCMCMVYDEIALMLETTKLDQRLCAWIAENMAAAFPDDYVIEEEVYNIMESNAARDISTSMKPKMVMDHNGETSVICMAFYSLLHCINEKQRKKQLVPLCAMFNLLQSCEKVNEGSLEGVDALLGCGLILFDLDQVETLLPEWQTDEVENACHLLFAAIDWCREMLNCFSSVAEDEEIHMKLICRLKDILQLELVMEKLLPKVSSFTPLHLQSIKSIHGESNSIHKSQSQALTFHSHKDDSDSEKQQNKPASKFDTMESLRPHLRPLKIQSLAVLKAPNQDDQIEFNYGFCNYILQDINGKLDTKLIPPVIGVGKKKSQTKDDMNDYTSQNPLFQLTNRQLVQEMIRYLPKILQMLEAVNEDMQSDDTQHGRIAEGAKDKALCISLIVDILYKLFTWPDIENSENQDLLLGLINTLAEQITSDVSQRRSISDRFKGAFRYLTGFQGNIPQFQTAVTMFKLLEHIMILSCDSDILQNDAYRVASNILSQDWFDWREAKKDIPFLVEKAIELHEDPLRLLIHYVNEVLPTFEREEQLESYPLLKSETEVSFYQAIIHQTIKSFDLLEKTDQDVNIVLVQTSQVVNLFERITNYVKLKEQRELFGVLLKTSRAFIEQFTKHSMPFFTRVFKDHKDEIVGIFKQFQIATRLLQIICSHVKVIKDTKLATYVPPLKKALEFVIFQVKMLLTENNAPSDVFFLGALKHRDITGAQVSSQVPKEISSDSEAESSVGEPQSSKIIKNKKKSKPKSATTITTNPPTYRTPSQVPPSDTEDDDIPNDNNNDDQTGTDGDDEGMNLSDNDDEQLIEPSNKRAQPMDYAAFTRFLDQTNSEQSRKKDQPSQQHSNPMTIFSSDDDTNNSGTDESSQQQQHRLYNSVSRMNNHPTDSSRSEKPFDLHSTSSSGRKRGYGLGMTRKRSKY